MGWDSSESGLFVFLHPGALEPSNLTPLISIRQGMCISFELFSLLSETNSSGLGMDVTSALSVCVRQDLTRKQFYGVVCFWMKSPNRLSGVVPPPICHQFFCWSLMFLFPPYVITISIENSDSHHIFPPQKNHPDLPKGGHFWGDSTRRGKFVGRLTAPPRWFGMGWWLIVTYWYIISYNVHRHVDTPYISLCYA